MSYECVELGRAGLGWVGLCCTLSNAVNDGQVADTDHQRHDMVQMLDSFPKLFMYEAVDACDEGVEPCCHRLIRTLKRRWCPFQRS